MFSKKLVPKTKTIVFFLFFSEFVHTKYKDNDIKKKRTFQTIGKTNPGGVIEGLIVSYHSESVFPEVNKLPIKATE